MQMVMILQAFRFRRILPVFSLAALLAGCAAQPVSHPLPDTTVNDLQATAHAAYRQGFEAGRRYQREVDWRRQEASKAATLKQPPAPPPPPPPEAATTAPAAPQALPAPLSPSSSYTTSGPAQPLQ